MKVNIAQALKRKLQGWCFAFSGEIERCLKKVSEGVETFEDIWQKVSVRNHIFICELLELR